MIVKKNFNLGKVFWSIRYETITTLIIASTILYLHKFGIIEISIPFSIAAILGSSLAIFIAFRNQSSYARWWEARTIWGGIVNNSRILARQIIASSDNAYETGKSTQEISNSYKKEIIYRQIAFANALRIHLRQENDWEILADFLEKDELEELKNKYNKPNIILNNQGKRVKEGIKQEILGTFDNISIEPNLSSFNNWQGSCERIKNTPLPMNYQYFTKIFLYVFIFIIPFCLTGDFIKLKVDYLVVPISFIISFVFSIMNKVGEINENPFENKIYDIPMKYLCNTIERDLKEMLNEKNLPEKMIPVDGYLY